MKTIRFIFLIFCMISVLTVCASAEDEAGGKDTSESTDVFVAFSVADRDGGVTEETDASVATLKSAISKAESGTVITLFTDYVLKQARSDYFLFPDGVSLDLNGHSITATCNLPTGIFRQSNKKHVMYLYSSAPGAKILPNEKSPVFSITGKMVIGESARGETFPRENLSLTASSVAKLYMHGNLALRGADIYVPAHEGSFAVFQAMKEDAVCEIADCRLFLTAADTVFSGGSFALTATLSGSRLFLGDGTRLTDGTGTLAVLGESSIAFPPSRGTESETTFNTPTSPEREDGCPAPIAETFPCSVSVGTYITAPAEHLSVTGGVLARVRKTVVSLTAEEKTLFPDEQDGLFYRAIREEDGVTATFVEHYDGSDHNTYTELWRRGEVPYHAFPVYLGTYYHMVSAERGIEEETTYADAVIRSTEAKVLGNLLLSESITFQLYLSDDGILQKAEACGLSRNFSAAAREEDGSVRFLVPADPKTLTDSFDLALTLSTGEIYHVEVSLRIYAESVIEHYRETPTAVRLVKALLAYVAEVSEYFYENGKLVEKPDAEDLADIRELLGEEYRVPTRTFDASAIPMPRGGGAIVSAALNLVSNPGYAFRLHPDFTGTVTVMTPTREEIFFVRNGTYAGEALLYVSNIGAGELRSEITVTCVGQDDPSYDMVFSYSLDSYMCGFGDDVPAYAFALYDYVLSVEEYVAADIPFRSDAH